MSHTIETLRNIGIIAHIDAGKTTLTERMLFYAGATHKMGDVDKGTTETDFDEEEQQRGITIYSACVSFKWRDVQINLIDTPGHVDFTAEVERSLRVLDGGVVVFSAREGVEAQSETVWRQADHYRVPRIAFINKMDREGADFEGTFGEIRERLEANPVAIAIPVGEGPPHMPQAFRGVIDLVDMKLRTADESSLGRDFVDNAVPGDLLVEAKLWRERMLEQLYDYSDKLMEMGLAGEQPPIELIRATIRNATLHRMIVPVLCGSALDYIGVQKVLDAVQFYLPSPADVPPVDGVNPWKNDAKETRKPNDDEPFAGLVFKVVPDKHGDLSYVRIYSGTLKGNTRLYNAANKQKENAAQIWHIQADNRQQIQEAHAGDIVGIIGLRHSFTGDTLSTAQEPIVLETIKFPETVISMAIEPESSTERKKLGEVLDMMKRQDPTFRARENEETGQTLISGMGELHLEVIKNRLLRDFNLHVKVHNPRVSYRETVERRAETTGECPRLVGSQTLFAKVKIRLEPDASDANKVTVLNAAGESLPPAFAHAAMEVLRENAEGGGHVGFPLIRVRITLLGGETHETESNELAFRLAASDAFRTALNEAGFKLLEPIMKLEIVTPDEHLGEFVSDLQQRRATITHTESRGKLASVTAEAPLARLFGYSSAMRSMSQGRATCSMEPASYGPAPADVQEKFL
ncbi:MAG: elongation factor G [Pirellulales bacterium]